MSQFMVNWAETKSVELEVLATKDVVVCSAVLNEDSARTDFAVGDCRFDASGTDLTMAFVPKHERFGFSTSVSGGLKAVTLVVDPAAMMKTHGLAVETLPRSLLRTIQRRGIVLEKLVPGHFGRIARDVAARRAMFPSLAALYHESKTFELACALLNELARRDAVCCGNGAFDPGILDRIGLIKQKIDDAPHRSLDVDDLARIAAMNRTKLRSSFKQVYGTTLSEYRTALLLRRADGALKEGGASVKHAARLAGYATTSSFIVAYKRMFGVSPGGVLRG